MKFHSSIFKGAVLAALSLLLLMPAGLTRAQEEGELDLESYRARLALASEMMDINPPRHQVEDAIDRYIALNMPLQPEAEKARFKAAMIRVLNYRALEDITRKAYAEIFTLEELEAMVEYYSKPEAISAREKMDELQGRIAPVILKMMDQALMRAKTTRE